MSGKIFLAAKIAIKKTYLGAFSHDKLTNICHKSINVTLSSNYWMKFTKARVMPFSRLLIKR
jgi:hypothetical protein